MKTIKPHNLYAAGSLLDLLFQPEIYVTKEGSGEGAWRATHDDKESAVDNGDHTGQIVATYRLVRVEKLALKRTTKVVKA